MFTKHYKMYFYNFLYFFQTVITLEDGKLVQKQSGDKEVTIIREVEGDQMKTVSINFS